MNGIGLYAVFTLLSVISPPSASPQISLFSIPSSLCLPPFLPFLCQPLSFTFTHSFSFLPSLSPFLNLHLSLSSHLSLSASQHLSFFSIPHLYVSLFLPPLFSASQSHSPLLTHHLLFHPLLSSFLNLHLLLSHFTSLSASKHLSLLQHPFVSPSPSLFLPLLSPLLTLLLSSPPILPPYLIIFFYTTDEFMGEWRIMEMISE